MARPTGNTKTRASGRTAGEESAVENAKVEDDHIGITDDADKTRTKWRTPGFFRMRTEWRGDDAMVLTRVRNTVNDRLIEEFADAYQIMFALYDLVREPVVDDDGVVQTDEHGFTLWRRDHTGQFMEDFTKLTAKEREHFLFQTTTHLWDWEQRQADAWAEAMFSKAIFEERYSIAFDEPMHGTIEDREARGKVKAAEDRYYAVMVSWYSRRVDALVRSMERLSLRLRDLLAT